MHFHTPEEFPPLNLPLIRLQMTGDQIHKRGFPLAIGPDEPHMLALQQSERHMIKNSTITKSMT